MKSTNKFEACDDVIEHIEAYIDNDLLEEEASLVDKHIQSCPSCLEELAFAREIQTELRAFQQMECPDRVIEAVYQHVEQHSSPVVPASSTPASSVWGSVRAWWNALRPSPVFTPALALGVTAVIAVGGWLLFRPASSPTMSAAEIADAKRQVEWTLAYLGSVNTKVAAVATGEVVQSYIVNPVQRAVGETMETNIVQ